MNEEEVRRVVELDDHFVVVPALRSSHGQAEYRYSGMVAEGVRDPYNSLNVEPMSYGTLRAYLRDNNFLD